MTENPRRTHQVKKSLKWILPEMVVIDLESIKNLKDWTIMSYLLTLVGGILAGGGFLLLEPTVEKILPTLSLIFGTIMVILGVLIELLKFRNFTENIENSAIEAGSIYYGGDTFAEEETTKAQDISVESA